MVIYQIATSMVARKSKARYPMEQAAAATQGANGLVRRYVHRGGRRSGKYRGNFAG